MRKSELKTKKKDLEGKKRVYRKKYCKFCGENITVIDYKDSARLTRMVTDRGKIIPRRVSGTCTKHQRMVATAVNRARFVAILPYTSE